LTDLRPVMIDPHKLTALGEETRGHPPKQIRKICRSLRAFGFVYPSWSTTIVASLAAQPSSSPFAYRTSAMAVSE